MKPTRGMWEWGEVDGQIYIAPSLAICDGEKFETVWIAKIRNIPPTVPDHQEITNANAQLVASAPAMLWALQEIALAWPASEAARIATEAIAKAHGEDK